MEFIKTTLGEISVGKGQYGIGASAVEYSKDLYTYLRITDINDDGTLNMLDLKSVDDEKAAQYVMKPNDIVFARTGNSTGRNYFYDGSDGTFVYAGFLIKFSIDPSKVNPKYIKYYCLSDEYKNWVRGHSTGSTRGNINAQTYANMEVTLPPRAQQDKLVSILENLDLKRKNNAEINRNLSEQAMAIFTDLFGDADKDATVDEVSLNVTDGVHNTVKDDSEGKFFLLSCKNIKGGSLSLGEAERRINQETFEKLRKRTKLEKGDILLSSVGTIGELLLMSFDPDKYEFQRSVAIIKPNSDVVSSEYLYCALLAQKQEIIRAAHGAVQQCIFISDIKGFTIHKPTSERLIQFDNAVVPMMKMIYQNEEENKRLSLLRDTLLPKLMSGELDVSELDI